jgi:histidinol-phosphate phosphatase family protein
LAAVLDRDGVINEKLENEYVKSWDGFSFKEGTLEALAELRKIFRRLVVVTNQRDVGLRKLAESELNIIHNKILFAIDETSGKIDMVYYCIDVDSSFLYRKPNIGMAQLARHDFREIEFSKSTIVSDSVSDMEFGKKN